MQFPPGFDRYLVTTVEECAARIVELLGDKRRREAFGQAAREHIRRGYLLPRLLRDELKLIRSVLRSSGPSTPSGNGTNTRRIGRPAHLQEGL